MGNSVVVHLIRHEKTKANWQRKYLGWTDEPIAIRKAVCSVPVHTETVYGSDLKRYRLWQRFETLPGNGRTVLSQCPVPPVFRFEGTRFRGF